MKKKKILALILSAALTLSLTACSDNNEQPNNSKDNSSKTSTSSNTTPENSDNSEATDSGSESGNSSSNSSDSTSSSSSDNTSSTPAEQPDEDKYTQAFWDSLEETPGSEFEYEILAEGIKVTGYTGTSGIVKVPAVIDGEQVREIDLFNSKNIKVYYMPEGQEFIKIPSSVTALYIPGSYTFYNDSFNNVGINYNGQSYFNNVRHYGYLENLESITFGNGIKGICMVGMHTTYDPNIQLSLTEYGRGLQGLKYVHLSDDLEYMHDGCFYNCPNLESIVIPSGITKIYIDTFKNCTNLKNVTFSDNTRVFAGAFDGTSYFEELLAKTDSYVKLGTCIYDGSKCTGDIVIPDGTEVIDANAFSGNDKITSVTIPSSVISIAKSAFAGCARLKTVTINGSPKILGYAFQGCLRLEEFNCTGTPENSAGSEYPFDNCPNLKTKPF